jgi:hypothetical protein
VKIIKRAAPTSDDNDDEDDMKNQSNNNTNGNDDDDDETDDDENGNGNGNNVKKLGGELQRYPHSQHHGAHTNMGGFMGRDHATQHPIDGRDPTVKQHKFERRAHRIAQATGMPKTEAMRHARRADPEAYEDYRLSLAYGGSGNPGMHKAQRVVEFQKRASMLWNDAVEAMSRTRNISKCEAASEVRRHRPDLWEQYQASALD